MVPNRGGRRAHEEGRAIPRGTRGVRIAGARKPRDDEERTAAHQEGLLKRAADSVLALCRGATYENRYVHALERSAIEANTILTCT